jgi:hypothetical protein
MNPVVLGMPRFKGTYTSQDELDECQVVLVVCKYSATESGELDKQA